MKPTLRAGIVLGLAVIAWMFIFGFAGWYKDPAMVPIWYVVILIQAGVIAWGLTLTKAEGKRYGGQLMAGTLISVYGGIIIIFGSLLFTMVVFPDALDVAREMQAEQLLKMGMNVEQIEAAQEGSFMLTPAGNAIVGFVATVITGFILSLILAAIIRKKD